MSGQGFDGLRVLSLESRRAQEMAKLIANQGGRPMIAPQRFGTTSQSSICLGRMRTRLPTTAARPHRAVTAAKSGGACWRSATSRT